MFKFLFIISGAVLILGCDQVKQKTKTAINKTGETVGKGTSEFINGVSEGVDQTFECKVNLSKEFEAKGLQYGKFIISGGPDGKNNLLTVYLIFNKDFKDTLLAKLTDTKGLEYGRTRLVVEGKSGEAKFLDFTFDKRTNIESKSTFSIE